MINILKRLKNKREYIIAFLILAFLILLGIKYFEKTLTIEVEDKCGRFINLVQHTINDGSDCEARCISQCQTKSLRYKQYKFEKTTGCNKCICECK